MQKKESPQLKRVFIEPRVYGILLTSPRGTLMHLDVHHTLDEAFEAGENKFNKTFPIENALDKEESQAPSIELWTTMPVSRSIAHLTRPDKIDRNKNPNVLRASDPVEMLEKTKNYVMNRLVEKWDDVLFKKAKSHLSDIEIKYIQERRKSQKK